MKLEAEDLRAIQDAQVSDVRAADSELVEHPPSRSAHHTDWGTGYILDPDPSIGAADVAVLEFGEGVRRLEQNDSLECDRAKGEM